MTILTVNYKHSVHVNEKSISGIKLEKSVLLFPMFDNMSLMPKAANLRTMLNWQGYIVGIALSLIHI